jgi:hypothetical protein
LLTQEAVAAEAGVCLRTVAGRWRTLGLAPKPPFLATDLQDGAPSGSWSADRDPWPVTLAEAAEEQRRERHTFMEAAELQRKLEDATCCLRRRGAEPETLPTIDPALRAYPGVHRAEQEAIQAQADAARRAEQRRASQERSSERQRRIERYAEYARQADGAAHFAEELAAVDQGYATRVVMAEDPVAKRNLILSWENSTRAREKLWLKLSFAEAARRADNGETEREYHLGRRFGPPKDLWSGAVAELEKSRPRRVGRRGKVGRRSDSSRRRGSLGRLG